jgi:hypothetical protein
MKKRLAALTTIGLLAAGAGVSASQGSNSHGNAVSSGSKPQPVLADATAPTNGGNGAGQSGQCTGNPNDRPAVCPAT